MKIKGIRFSKTATRQAILAETRFHQFYSSSCAPSLWRPEDRHYLAININMYGSEYVEGETRQDQLRWMREITYGVTES